MSLDYHIRTTEDRVDERTRVLKNGETFAVFDHFGDIRPAVGQEQGLYYGGTRFLSQYELRFGTDRPLFLSSTIDPTNAVLSVDVTNPDLHRDGALFLEKGKLHIRRSKFLLDRVAYESIRVSSFAQSPIAIDLALFVGADFADVFEVRGTRRPRRGTALPEHITDSGLILGYQGLDGRVRRACVSIDVPAVARPHGGLLIVPLSLEPQETRDFVVTIACELSDEPPVEVPRIDVALSAAVETRTGLTAERARVHSSNPRFEQWIERSVSDVYMMLTPTPSGVYPYAGIPWYSAPFGRDGIITALQMLWFDPAVARGVLTFLAATQAVADDPERDAQPGKIIHELRNGEMAALGEVPFGRYYGSADATPLFVVLAGRYLERTNDVALLRTLWPNLLAAVDWIDKHGDLDGDGYVEYAKQSSRGLVHQGWKDSHDSVFHRSGSAAAAPIALCEVQAYVYAAKHHAADLADAVGERAHAKRWRADAERLRKQFEQDFWCEELGTYALALDSGKKRCEVVASNAGHALFAGIALRARAARVAETLMSDAGFSGWGVRTVASTERNYNPMSYHNGSVWPHDNALIAMGFARYGLKEPVLRLLNGFYWASTHFDLHRLPELFCGFARQRDEAPTLYPVACSPQSWASATGLALIEATLGLDVNARERRVSFTHPRLPAWLDSLRIEQLRVGDASVDLLCERRGDDVGVTVLARAGRIAVSTTK